MVNLNRFAPVKMICEESSPTNIEKKVEEKDNDIYSLYLKYQNTKTPETQRKLMGEINADVEAPNA